MIRALKRRLAQWVLRQLQPELGEWRIAGRHHWRLQSINITREIYGGHGMDLHYVSPLQFMQFDHLPDDEAGE